jgi:mono/diheme cytochrome c family protein
VTTPYDIRRRSISAAGNVDGIRVGDLTGPPAFAGAAAVALALSACEVVDRGDNVVNGKALFIERCGACHALARAGTGGTIGPDLDAAFRRARADGLGADTIAGVVEKQILHPRRGSRMPAKLVTGDGAEDVAAYVAEVAAVPGRDSGRLADVGQRRGGPPGRRIFVQAGCGSCHRLADAATSGTSGPDLDETLNGRSKGFIRESIVDPAAVAAEGFSSDVMPADFGRRLSNRELDALVEYLADTAG